MPARLTLKTVNDEPPRLGHAEEKADDYFLFTGGEPMSGSTGRSACGRSTA